VRIAWKHLPLSIHKDSPLAHLASMAAAEQGKFWEYHDKLFAAAGKLKLDDLNRYASELGLDMAKFKDSIMTARNKPVIDADAAEAAALGVSGTPAFFVNGHYMSGAKPFGEFATAINAELKRLNLPIPAAAAAEAAGS